MMYVNELPNGRWRSVFQIQDGVEYGEHATLDEAVDEVVAGMWAMNHARIRRDQVAIWEVVTETVTTHKKREPAGPASPDPDEDVVELTVAETGFEHPVRAARDMSSAEFVELGRRLGIVRD